MYNNFFNPFFVSSDIQLIQTNFKTTLKSAMEDQNDQNIQQVIALIRCLNLALDIPPLAQELTNNYNAQNLLEIAQIKLAKFITTEYGNELQLLLQKLQSENRKASPYNILEIMQFQNEEVLYIFIRLLRIQLLYFDVNRQQAYDYFFFFKEVDIPSQLYEEFIQFIMKQLMILPKEYKDRFIDILIYLNRQSQEISEQLLKKQIIDQFLQMCLDPLYTKRSLILIRDLLETSEETVIEVESTSEILFNLLKASKDNKQIVQLISQIISKIQPQQQQQQSQNLSINDNQMLEDQIDQICFSMLQQTFEYDVQFVDQLIQIIYKEDCSENIYLSTSFLIEKYLADMNSPQRVQISEACYKLIVQNQNPRVCQAYLQLLQILNIQYKLSIKIEFLDTMRELHQDNMKILRQLDDLQRKKKKKFNKFNSQDFESIESFTQFSMNRSTQIRKSSQGPNRSEQEDNELDQIIKLTLKNDDLFVTVDCFKYLLEAQKVNQDIVLQYLEQIIDVFLLYPLENTIRELAITLFDTINPQEFIAHMVQDIESYDEYTLKLIAGLSLFPKYFDYYTIEKILNFMLQFIIMKIEGNHLNYILIICYNLNLKQPQLIHYIYSIADKHQQTPIKCVGIALAILHKQKYQTDITNRILQLQEQLIDDLEEDRFYSQNCILLEQYMNLLSIQKDKSKFVVIVKQHLQYIQYENVSIDRRLMIFTIIKQLIMQSDPEQIITQTPYLFITYYMLKNFNDYLQINTNLIFTDRFTGYYQTLSIIILANQDNILFQEMYILQFLNQIVENTIQSFQLLENKFLIPTLLFIQDTTSIFDHQFLLPLLQSLIEYACESIVSTQVLIPIWKILLKLFDQPPLIEYYQNTYPNNKLSEIGFRRDKQLFDLTILLLKKLAVDEKQIELFQQQAIEQNIIKEEEEEEQNIIQDQLNENQNNQYSNQDLIVQEQNQNDDELIVAALIGQQQLEQEVIREDVIQEEQSQRQEEVVLETAIIVDRDIQQEERRQEELLIERVERRQDAVLATALIADREMQQDNRRQEDKQIQEAERRQDEVLTTAIQADREIQKDDRWQEDQQIDRMERRQDAVLAGAFIADREMRKDDRRTEERQIERVENRQNAVLATAIVADGEIQQDYRRQEDRQIDRDERRQDEVLTTAILADREIQKDDRRQEDRQIDRMERQQDAVLATAIVADREFQKDDRRKEERQIERTERRQEEVLATAIVTDREIQKDERRQDDRQIERTERRQDEVLATAIVADREIQKDERRQDDRQIERTERRQDEVLATAIVADRELQKDERRQDDRQIERTERRQDEVLATAIVADREIQKDERRQDDRQIERTERRQDEVLATAIVADREIQNDDRRQEERQTDRVERRQDAVLATALIADREMRKDERRQEERQIERIERRQDAVLATAVIADREIKKDDRRQQDQFEKVERKEDVAIAATLAVQNEGQNLTPTLTGEATINKEGDWQFQNLYDIATALDMVIGNNQLMNKFPQISQAIKTFITSEQSALNCHQIHILNKLLILQQTEETQECIQQILQFKKSSKISENLIQWQLIKITEINLQILYILKSTNQIVSMIARLIGQKEIIPLINSLETINNLEIIKSILECLDAYCISERVANFYGQYNIVFYVEKWINLAPSEVYSLIGSLCLSNKLQNNFIEKKIYGIILKTIESKEIQLLANTFYALSALCFESPVSLEIFSQKLNDIILGLLSQQCEPIILETMCAFISNVTYKNDKLKQSMRIFTAHLINQLQRQNQVLVIQQILRAISNLIYIKENAQIADNQKILEIIKPLLNTPQCICDVLDLYTNLGAHQYLKKDIILVVIDLIQSNLDKTNIISCALDTLNAMASQFSGFILEHLELILDLTTQANQEILFKSYRLISNLIPKNREFFSRNNIIGKLSLQNNTKIDQYYNKMVQILDNQQQPKLVAPKLIENPYDKLHNGYSIILFREDGSSIFCELKIMTNKEIFAVQADGYLSEKFRIRFLMEMNFNVPKVSREYQICSKNNLFKYQQFFVLKGKEHNNKNINIIQAQVMSVSLKQELYEVLSLIFK